MQTRYCPHCGLLNYPSQYTLKPCCFVCLAPLEGEAMPDVEPYRLIEEGGTLQVAQEIETEKELMYVLSFLCDVAEREGYEMQLRVTGPDTAASCRRKHARG